MKLKSHSGTKKRIKVTKKGEILFNKPCRRHLLINKSKRQKALYRSGMPVHSTDRSKIKLLLPMSF